MESFAHRTAKELLAQWYRDDSVAMELGKPTRCVWPHLFRPSMSRRSHGVWLEYPLVGTGDGLDVIWDECGWDGTGTSIANVLQEDHIPTFEELCVLGTPPTVILDVAVASKGNIVMAFEVIHKSDVTPEKLERLKMLNWSAPRNFEVWTVPAHWILGQIDVPKKFVGTRII